MTLCLFYTDLLMWGEKSVDKPWHDDGCSNGFQWKCIATNISFVLFPKFWAFSFVYKQAFIYCDGQKKISCIWLSLMYENISKFGPLDT